MDIEQMKAEGGHGVFPDVIRRAEYFLYSMKWKVCPLPNGGLTLSATNNQNNEVPYGLFVSFAPGGAMNVSIDIQSRDCCVPAEVKAEEKESWQREVDSWQPDLGPESPDSHPTK